MNKKLVLLPALLMLLTSCGGGGGGGTKPTKHDGQSEATAFTAAEAVQACVDLDLQDKQTTTDKYYVKDVVSKIYKDYDAANKNISLTLGSGEQTFVAYQVGKMSGENVVGIEATDPEAELQVGDTVCVYGVFYRYGSTYETPGKKAAGIVSYTFGPEHVTPEHHDEPALVNGTVAQFMADTAGNYKQRYQVTAVVTRWVDGKTDGQKYGNFYISDDNGTTELYVYGATATEGKLVWGTDSYSFSNPQDFLTNATTSQITIGTQVTMILTRCDYTAKDGTVTIEGQGIVTAVVQPN